MLFKDRNTYCICVMLQQFIVQTRFVCQFNIEGRVTSVNANLLGDTIYCESMEFSYTSKAPNITATFAVIWGGSKPLDNPDNIHGEYLNSKPSHKKLKLAIKSHNKVFKFIELIAECSLVTHVNQKAD